MDAGGWVTSGAPNQGGQYAAGCGGYNTFWAYSNGVHVGYVTATFNGSGNGLLNFGNCFRQGVTNVYLNGQCIGSANANQNSKINFKYNKGDILKITEENIGIIKINSLQLCHG